MADQKCRRGGPSAQPTVYVQQSATPAPSFRKLQVELCHGRTEPLVRDNGSAGTATGLFSFLNVLIEEINGRLGLHNVRVGFYDSRDPATRELAYSYYVKLSDSSGSYFSAPFIGSFSDPDRLHPSVAAAFNSRHRRSTAAPLQLNALTPDQLALLQQLAANGTLNSAAVPQPLHGAPVPAVLQPFHGAPVLPAVPQPAAAAAGDPAPEGEDHDELLEEEAMQP